MREDFLPLFSPDEGCVVIKHAVLQLRLCCLAELSELLAHVTDSLATGVSSGRVKRGKS